MEKEISDISLEDAINNLAVLSQLEIDQKSPLGIINDKKFVIQDEGFSYEALDYLLPDNACQLLEMIKESYSAISRYLQKLYDKDFLNWDEKLDRKGIQSIMVLAGEAANKLNDYLTLFDDSKICQNILQTDQYKNLQKFYLEKFSKKFSDQLEGDKAWERQWEESKSHENINHLEHGLNDFDSIKNDLLYELFYLTDENAKPFFNPSMLRNIKLFCDFDEKEMIEDIEDPFLRVTFIQDRDMQVAAKTILKDVFEKLKTFYKNKIYVKQGEFTYSLNKAIAALFLAANEKNLIKNSSGKSSTSYFNDFLFYINESIGTYEYQKLLSYDSKIEKSKELVVLVQSIINAVFTRVSGVKEELIGFVYRLIRKGEEKRGKKELSLKNKSSSIFEKFLYDDDSLRKFLKSFPNGPLFKTLDIIRKHDEEVETEFNPYMQKNLPSKLFELDIDKHKINVLRLFCPTKQMFITKSRIINEFRAFLNYLTRVNKKILLINLQDRNSYFEEARSLALEQVQKNAQITDSIFVFTFDSSSIFYNQTNEFSGKDSAKDFLKTFYSRIENPEENGFFIPQKIVKNEFFSFIKNILNTIHVNLFAKKSKLSREERLIFIDIAYQFITLKLIEVLRPDNFCFTCKDAIDTSPSFTATFFAMLKLLQNNKISQKDFEFMHFLYYFAALTIRERSIHSNRLIRSVSTLSFVDNCLKKDKNAFKSFFKLFKNLENFKALEEK
jgi:hypothetical protein